MFKEKEYSLKPCPFCGGKAKLEKSFRAFIGGETRKVAFVHCVSCSARSGRVPISNYGKSSHSYLAEQKAVDFWNTRAEDSTAQN